MFFYTIPKGGTLLKKFLLFFSGLFLFAAGVMTLYNRFFFAPESKTEEKSIYTLLSGTPDYDYIGEIENLIARKKFSEAETLCQDLIAADLPQRREAEILQNICKQNLHSVRFKLLRTADAFLTGESGSSIETLGGAVAADMLFYGDIRDLMMQGYYRSTGQKYDPFIITLSGVGIITEFADVADLVPALLKSLYKTGAFTRNFSTILLNTFRRIIKYRRIDSHARNIFYTSGNLVKQAGFIRSKNIFRVIDTENELLRFAGHVAKSPEETHLMVKAAGKNSLEILEKLSRGKDRKLKKILLQKGKNISRIPKISARIGKIFYKHHDNMATLCRKFLHRNFLLIAIPLLIAGTVLLFAAFYRKRKKSAPSQLDAKSSAPRPAACDRE